MHAARWGGWSENVGSRGGNAYAWENAPHDIGRQRKNATRAADLAGAPRARTRRASLFSRRRSYSPAIAASSMAFWGVKEPGGLLVGCRTRRVCELTVLTDFLTGCEGGAKQDWLAGSRQGRAVQPPRPSQAPSSRVHEHNFRPLSEPSDILACAGLFFRWRIP